MQKIIILFLSLFLFFMGLYLYSTKQIFKVKNIVINEPLKSKSVKCPNTLIKKNNTLLLYNNTDRNDELPIQFNNLDEYINYVYTQRKNGIECPILYLQQENDTQGNDVYRIRPDPFNLQGGMHPITVAPIIDSNRNNPPYNNNNYPGFDPQGLQIGVYNKLDEIHDSTGKGQISDNPADFNWGGVEYTQSSVDMGKYKENEVTKPVYYTPKNVQYFPNLYKNIENPISYKERN